MGFSMRRSQSRWVVFRISIVFCSHFYWDPSIYEYYYVGNDITWMAYEGDTKDLAEDSYFLEIK